ncbi:unnamed protein product [Phaedon cochleariae]|uniref:DUF4781 domain-containing protein n=1 Tax=Phaedon cochleariae TaxID=80249 RepID=A0A9N9SIH9_PHACE|nr:unnamed protein product [Phaedon cochleariae]
MAYEEQTVIFCVTYNGVDRSFELLEYDVVGSLKERISRIFDIPPETQVIDGWKNVPEADNTILQSCGDTRCVTFLSVRCLEKSDNRRNENNATYDVPSDDDIEAAISGFMKIQRHITSGIEIKTVTLSEAITECCFASIQERKVLLLYLHKENDDFSRLFLKNVNNTKVSNIMKKDFFLLAWDVENTQYHGDMERALCEFELSSLASLVRTKTCCALFIQNISDCIAVNSKLAGKIPDKDFLNALVNTSSILAAEKKQEVDLHALERTAGSNNDMTSIRYQQLMSDLLGDRDYDSFEYNQHQELKDKIAYALFGPPEKEEGYDRKQTSRAEKIYLSIIENSNEISEFRDLVEISFIYNCTEPLAKEKIQRAKKYGNSYNPNTDLMPVPIFVLRKCHNSNNPCRIFIDDIGRVYQSWNEYKNKNKLHECKMVLPRDGRYEVDRNDKVLLETHLSPACGLDIKILQGADMVSTGAGLASGGVFLAAIIPAVTVAPAVLAVAGVVGAGTGLYAIGRSIHTLVDRSKHKETMSFANSEARGAYLNIVAGALGFVGAGANMAVSQLAARGFNIGTGAGAVVNTLGVANIGASGVSLINSTIDVVDQWINENQTPSLLTIVQLSSSVLFFGNAVYNFRTCSSIVEESQARALQDYNDSLRSNRHRKTFNKLVKETIRQNNGNQASGRAEVISAIRNMPNKDEVFAALTRANRDMNRRGIRFYVNGGEITLNGQPIDINKFTIMSKNETSAFLSKLPMKSNISTNEVTSMQKILSNVDIAMPEMDAIARYAVQLLGSYTGSIQGLIVIALKDLLGYISAEFQRILIEIFPKASKYYNLLNMLVEFFSSVAIKLSNEKKAAPMKGDGQYVKLFEIAVKACFSGGHLSELALRELMEFFSAWLTEKIFTLQLKEESESRRQNHSGRPKVRAHCHVCNGYFYKAS